MHMQNRGTRLNDDRNLQCLLELLEISSFGVGVVFKSPTLKILSQRDAHASSIFQQSERCANEPQNPVRFCMGTDVTAWICMDQYQCKDHDTVSLVNFALSMEKSAFARGMHDRLRSMRVSSCR
jgi:hypothetical protein